LKDLWELRTGNVGSDDKLQTIKIEDFSTTYAPKWES